MSSVISDPRPDPISMCPHCGDENMGDLQLCQGGGKHIKNYGRWFQVVSTSFTCILYWSKYPEIGSVWSAGASAGATL